jgi:hypothetical protein
VGAVLTSCLLAWAAAALVPRDFPVGTWVDDAHYAVLAQSLRERAAYRTISLPQANLETKYPPLYPALLAAAWKPGLETRANLERLRAVNLVLAGPVAGALAALALALGMAPAAAAAAALAGTLAPRFMSFWTLPLSEPLFVLLVAAGLAAWLGRMKRAATALLVLAVHARTLALPFLAAALWLEWRENRRGALRLVAGAALALAPWAAWTMVNRSAVPPELLGYYGSYGGWLVEAWRENALTALVQVPVRNAVILVRSLGEAPGWWSWVPAWAAMLLGALLAGILWAARRDARLPVLGLGLYAVVVLWWPFPGDRFVASAWPLMLVPAAVALRPGARAAFLALCLGVAAFGMARGLGVREHRQRGAAWTALSAEFAPRLGSRSSVASPNPALYYLTFGTPAVPAGKMRTWRYYRGGELLEMWGDPGDLWALIRAHRPSFVATEAGALKGRPLAEALMRRCPGVLEAVWEHPAGPALYATNPAAACRPERATRQDGAR